MKSNSDPRNYKSCCLTLVLLLSSAFLFAQPAATGNRIFRAGAAVSNITPKIGTSMNGSMQDKIITNVHDETHARCIVLDDGETRLAIVVSDLCMVSREIVDAAKKHASEVTKIPVENMMMSATHTHTGGTACALFQSDPDKEYVKFLTERIADAVIRANNKLVPARIGWGVGHEPTQVFNRRWKMKPGTALINPFGNEDKVKMNPGFGDSNLEPAGPVDPEIPLISVQTPDGRPIAVLANYSLHYVGGNAAGELSADYYGMFADRVSEMLGADKQDFVAIMSNGTSGNINNINYGGPPPGPAAPYEKMRAVANVVAAEAYKVYQNIEYKSWISLDSRQKEISLAVRKPAAGEIKRAREIIAKAKKPVMTTMEEIYARETVLIKDYPDQVPMVLQAFRLGDLAIAAVPCEVFVEIGLNIKKKSPFKPTFTISLANGYNGYLPTPEHHALGGYETWRARSSYLEVNASDKIKETLYDLLEKLSASQPKTETSSSK